MNTPTIDQFEKLKNGYLCLFNQWLREVPPYIMDEADKQNTSRHELKAFMLERMVKLTQDTHAVFALLASNHIGTAMAVNRIVRDNAMEMLLCAFCDASDDSANIYYLNKSRPSENAKKLLKICDTFEPNNDSSDLVLNRIKSARNFAKTVLLDSINDKPSEKSIFERKRGFRLMAETAMDLLNQQDIPSDLLALHALDYWMECEAIHPGPNSHLLYTPQNHFDNNDLNSTFASLCGIRDLYPMKSVITSALLQTGSVLGKIEKHPVAEELEKVAEKVEKIILAVETGQSNA